MDPGIVGFRFHPTPDELVTHYLKRKLQKIDDEKQPAIPELNLYNHNPRDLPAIYNEKSCVGSASLGCFFLCPRVRMNADSGTSKKRCNKRKAGDGYWKETSKKQDVEDEDTGEIIGTKRIFAFYEGNQRNARQTDLALHEYHLSQAVADESIPDPTAYSLCHIKKKKQRKKAAPKKQQRKKAAPKKKQNGLSDSPFRGANSGGIISPGMPEGMKTQESNLEGSSLAVEGLNAKIRPDILLEGSICHPEQVEQSPIIHKHSNSEQDDAGHRIGHDPIQSYLQDGIGAEETTPDAAFYGETAMNWQNLPMKELCSWADFTTTGACEDVGNPSFDYDFDDFLALDDLWSKD